MKASVLIRSLTLLSFSLFIAHGALADRDRDYDSHDRSYYDDDDYRNHHEYGRVLDARPIYERVAVDIPSESCHTERVASEERRSNGGDSFAGTVVGGLVGAAIGHEIGNGRGAATAAGGLIGASIGHDAAQGQNSVIYRDERVCDKHFHTEYENRIVGYDVSYSYHGHIYQTRTDHHPGDRILVDVRIHTDRDD